MGRSGTAVLAAALLLSSVMVLSCTTDPMAEPPVQTAEDSSRAVIEKLELSYDSLDLDMYLECLTGDFQFLLDPVDWADYDGDGVVDSCWGKDIEEQIHEELFEGGEVEAIELTLDIPEGVPDSVGFLHQCEYGLKLYLDGDSLLAAGSAALYTRRDADGLWRIWKCRDFFEGKITISWGAVKVIFMSAGI